MPRGKGYRRSQAAKRRWAGERPFDVDLLPPGPEFVPRRGTGKRRRVKEWDRSVSGKQHKLVVPAHSPEKKFVLLVGDSHLRPFADGTVGLSKGNLSFGIMSTPGASACHLRAELIHAVLPRTPDAVCILAPGNNLTTSSTHEVAGEEFRELLLSACQRCANVFVVDFVPRLTVAPELQEHMSREFHSVAQKMGMFRVHLSDDDGMEILSKVLWDAAYKQLEVPAPKAKEAPRTPSPVPRTPPRLLVKEEVFAAPPSSPPPDPYVWMEMVKGKKRIQSEGQLCSPSKRRVVRHQVDGCPIVLKECFIPLNPVLFSTSMLAAMDAVVPAQLPSPDSPAVPQDATTPSVEPRVKRVACKRRLAMCQVKASPSVEEASPRPTSANVVVGEEEVDATPSAVTVSSEPSSTTAVEEVATEEGDATPGAVGEVVVEEVSRSGPPIQPPSRFIKMHIQDLKRSLGAEWCLISRLSVKADSDIDSATLLTDVAVDGTVATAAVVEGGSPQSSASSVRGSFHQADSRFQHAGVQCMAISLVAVAKHSIESVFSWQAGNLDKVVVLGDNLYNTLRDSNVTSEVSKLLSVPDLPKQAVIDGQTFDFQYEDCVSGFVNEVTSDLIKAGVTTSLRSGLEKMFSKYDTCFLTLGGNTCAVISQGGRFAVVDSHARSADGMVDGEGKSVVVRFTCLDDVFEHMCKFATAFKRPKQFEIASVCVIPRRPVPPVNSFSSPKVLVESRGSQSGCGLPVQPTVGCTSIKRKRSSGGFSSKKAKNSDYAAVDSDVVFVADVVSEGLQFNPLCGVVVDTLCKQLNVESEKEDLVSTEVGLLGAPCLKEKIVGDGNCFFRAVSQAVCGTQKHHRKIRLAVVKHLKANGGALRPEYSSMGEYLTMSKMAYVGSWATEVEIQAAADFFGVSIFTYCDGRWLEYSCKSKLLSNQGIYLENCNGNHYESVVCVQQPNMQCCYGYCKVGGSRYNLRKQGVVCADNLTSVASSICEAEVGIVEQNAQSIRKLSLSNYLVKKNNLQRRIKYQQNRQEFLEKMKMNYQGENGYKEKLNEMSKAKYRKNKSHRDTVKEMSKTKYRKNKSHRDTVKEMSKTKYRKNKSHRDTVRK
ncbi:uncharacterized protein LOC127370939 [Dicentrarchus labrax]|uniref:uncharacterized protein LOC127370939 n=1 Tax=Dicentrarchus labrax TaxID=13489 RepID=UPI0021F50FB7|nr:uncharacterized protein LOC127370939 [Dicentrarchus labrax]